MAKPFNSIKVFPSDNGAPFVLSFSHSDDMVTTQRALEQAGHGCEAEYPELGGVKFTPWLIDTIMRGVMGDRINTIKMVRVVSRVGLMEAINFVDDYMS